jgi:hypothetical protein
MGESQLSYRLRGRSHQPWGGFGGLHPRQRRILAPSRSRKRSRVSRRSSIDPGRFVRSLTDDEHKDRAELWAFAVFVRQSSQPPR